MSIIYIKGKVVVSFWFVNFREIKIIFIFRKSENRFKRESEKVCRFWKVFCGSIWGNFYSRNFLTGNLEDCRLFEKYNFVGFFIW